MNRSSKLIAFVIAIILFAPANVIAQSGRGRQPAPPPKPTPKPAGAVTTVLGVPEGGKLVKQDIDGPTARYILKNGLTVIIRERHSSPLVAVNISVRAGTVNEPDEMAGMARLTRQLILKGTAKRSGAAIDREVARLGGLLNSNVTYDQTAFNIIAPSESYQPVIELLADLIQRPAFNPDDVKSAAQLALLESKREQDAVETAAIEKLFATAFTANRLKRGSAVSETMLGAASRDQVLAFYQNFYHPENTVITVVGDIFSLHALGQLQLQFGNFKKALPKPAPTTQPAPKAAVRASNLQTVPVAETAAVQQTSFSANSEEPPQEYLRYGNSRADISQSFVTIGYRTPTFRPDKEGLKEVAAMQMMAAVLGLGSGSRLWQGLCEGQASRDKSSVAFETGARFLALPDTGIFILQMRVDADRIDRAEAEYFREIERFRRELVGEAELARTRVMLEKEYYDTVSKYDSEAEILSRYQTRFGDYRLFDSNLGRIRAVTAQEIQQAALKYLTLSNISIHEHESRNAQARTFTPEKFAELVITFEPKAGQPIKPEEVKPATALRAFKQGDERGVISEGQNVIIATAPLPIKDFSVLRGPRAYVKEDKTYPKLSVGVYFQGGRLIEDRTTSGTTELMLRSMLKSTTSRKFDLIAHELESYGGEIRVVDEPDFFGYTLDVMSRNAEPAVRLLIDIIENPFFDKVEVARERDALIARQAQQRDEGRARSIELMWSSLYPMESGHPYGLPRFGLAEVVKALNEEKLEAWHGKTVKKQFPLVLIVGDTDGSALVSKIFSEGLKRTELDKTLKANLPVSSAPPPEKAEQRSRQSSAIAIGFRAPGQSPERLNDQLALAMLGTIATSGKLTEELRDKRNLTDKVTVTLDPRLASSVFYATLSTLPENEPHAREALQSVLQTLATAQTTDAEFEQGRNAAIGRYAIGLQDHTARTMEYARAVIFGRKVTDVELQPDLIREVKKAEIRRAAESVLKSNQAGRGVVRAIKEEK
jgi:zinc protease